MKERHKAVPASYLLLIKDGKILLGRRCNTEYMNGMYMVPAGHVEAGEPLTAAMVREAMEEIGIAIHPEDLKLVHTMYRPKSDETGERLDFFFTAAKWEGIPVNNEPEKCDKLDWFQLENLPGNIVPYVKLAIENILKNIPLSEPEWK